MESATILDMSGRPRREEGGRRAFLTYHVLLETKFKPGNISRFCKIHRFGMVCNSLESNIILRKVLMVKTPADLTRKLKDTRKLMNNS